MNHRPFEDWLLQEQPLGPGQDRDLRAHLRTCRQCSALAETGAELRLARLAAPRAGFTERFGSRLATHRVAEGRRRFWGLLTFIAGGLAILSWLSASYVTAVLASPAQWIAIGIGYLVFIITSIQALTEVAHVLFRVVPGLAPAYVWMASASALALVGMLWMLSIWRFAFVTRGA